jgi:nucleoside-diphosphate-sugar epimerase
MVKTAIVTGVAGFIGSNLAERLLKEKYKVIGIDCFTDYYSKKIKLKNLSSFINNKKFNFIEEDLISVNFDALFKKDTVLFHQAGQPGVRASWGEQFETYVKDNILVTQRILESAKKMNNLKKIVMASSSSIYGNQEGVMEENSTLPKTISPYGATKLASENLGYLYYENFGLPITSLRYFTVYGPKQRPDMAFFKFIMANLSEQKIVLFGDGSQKRDFTFISDIVEANIKTLENNVEGEILNVGGGSVRSINEVLDIISSETGKKNKITFKNKEKGDVHKTEADVKEIEKKLNFKPKILLEEGLPLEIEWLKKIKNEYQNILK